LIHYPFTNLSELSFEFVTDQGVVYRAYFIAYGGLFPNYPEFSGNVYSFNLDVALQHSEKLVMDEKIALTVVAIFKSFFSARNNVAIYICDSADERHLARKKKFDFWFWKYNDGSIIKEDGIAVIADFEIYNSLLVHKQNKLADKIIEAFRSLNERADEK
jgi:hypothetical protein